MISVYEYENYREFLDSWILSNGENSYGMKGKIAFALGISSSLFSQIQKGERSLSLDQTYELAVYLGLNDAETDYLNRLVEFDKAGNHKTKEYLLKKIRATREQSKKIGTRVPRNRELNDQQKAIFYSAWLYTGITNLSAIHGISDVQSIANYLKVEPHVIQKIVRFLLEIGVCRQDENGRLTAGTTAIHVDRDSPFVNKHHQNWRFKSISQMDQRFDEDLFFTSPMSLSQEAANRIKKMIPDFIQEAMKISGPSNSEVVRCLNIDWFKY